MSKAAPDESFIAVYLNPISISNVQHNVGGDPQTVSFTVNGGVPEFYKYRGVTRYYDEIEIKDAFTGSVVETMSANSYTEGSTVTVTFPERSQYIVKVKDNISCENDAKISLSQGINCICFGYNFFGSWRKY
ncbi:MAG: hypothetical protein R2771_00490 [Saprospiraceae bacterium]